MKETILKSTIWWFIFWLSALIVWVWYAAITQVSSWDILTADLFNESMVPTWAVMAFNLSTCPVWWSEANGTDNSLDLRWEFIRWLDNWRWVDSGRVLATLQNWSEVARDYWENWVLPITSVVNADYSTTYSRWYRTITGDWSSSDVDTDYYWIRPRNIALLYCVKN